MQHIVYFHANCRDGLIAAWNMRNILEDLNLDFLNTVAYKEVNYNDTKPFKETFENINYQFPVEIIFVDFTPDIKQMDCLVDSLQEQGRVNVTIIDHHVDNIIKFQRSLYNYSEEMKELLTKPEYMKSNSHSMGSLVRKDIHGKLSCLEFTEHKDNHTFDQYSINEYTFINSNENKALFNFKFNVSLNNTLSGATLTMLHWITDTENRENVINYIKNTFPHELRKLMTDKLFTFDICSEVRNFINLSLHVSDADLYLWKFEKSDEFILALNEELVKRNFDFKECCKYLDNLIEDNESFNNLYVEGDKILSTIYLELEKHCSAYANVVTEQIDLPVFIANKSIVSRLSHFLTAEEKVAKTVFIISSMNEEKGIYHARVGSSNGSALGVAKHFNGGGHPDASGAELPFTMFSETTNKLIQERLKQVNESKNTCC